MSLYAAADDPASGAFSFASVPSSSWHLSVLADVEGDKPKRQKFKRYSIGFFHIDIAEVLPAAGKLYLFVGIDRTSSLP